MSRIGKKPIEIPAGVKVSVSGETVAVEGTGGKLSIALPPHVAVEVKENQVLVSQTDEVREAGAMHGLFSTYLSVSTSWRLAPSPVTATSET